ncbi:MAG: beta-ketoacyl synthase [Bacteroidetes bacterium]|nr:beta-ketoacyl synthase [Bacteroidota bacterium]
MMADVYAGAENIISSLGFNIAENIANILAVNTGIVLDKSGKYSPIPLPLSVIDHHRLDELFAQNLSGEEKSVRYTMLEKMFIISIKDALRQSHIKISSSDTLIIIASTKGNIDLLQLELQNKFGRERIYLHELGRMIAAYFNNPNTPLIVSNACISGVLGIVYGERLIKSGKYKHVIVTGGDLMSEFIVSGFQSFQSLSMNPCKPFDINRDGLNLGEGCGTLILSSDPAVLAEKNPVKILGGAGSNDANHISGPSRTGEGLYLAIEQALRSSDVHAAELDTISAHGTATDYNDEMESRALSRAGLEKVPVNSYKGYFGHTLGAAGVIEAAISLQSMKRNMLFRTAGYEEHGVSQNINVISKTEEKEINTCLKTASGFGGSNAALVFQK